LFSGSLVEQPFLMLWFASSSTWNNRQKMFEVPGIYCIYIFVCNFPMEKTDQTFGKNKRPTGKMDQAASLKIRRFGHVKSWSFEGHMTWAFWIQIWLGKWWVVGWMNFLSLKLTACPWKSMVCLDEFPFFYVQRQAVNFREGISVKQELCFLNPLWHCNQHLCLSIGSAPANTPWKTNMSPEN